MVVVNYDESKTLQNFLYDLNTEMRWDSSGEPYIYYNKSNDNQYGNSNTLFYIIKFAFKLNPDFDDSPSSNRYIYSGFFKDNLLSLSVIYELVRDTMENGPISYFVEPPLLNLEPGVPIHKAEMHLGTHLNIKDKFINFMGAEVRGIIESSTEDSIVPYSLLNKTKQDLENQIKHNAINISVMKSLIESRISTLSSNTDSDLLILRNQVQHIYTNLYQTDITVNPNNPNSQ